MNPNIYFVAIIMGSFIQPFSDMTFTVCTLAYQQQRDCLYETRVSTFVFTMIFFSTRFAHNTRNHIQKNSPTLFTKPFWGLVGIVSNINNSISSYLYNTYFTTGLQVYWIISTIIATFTVLYSDVNGDFGLLSMDK